MLRLMLSSFFFLLAIGTVCCIRPSGSLQGLTPEKCYSFVLTATSWFEAENDCQLRNGHLASIQNAFVNSFIIDGFANNFRQESFWLGASNGLTSSSNWTWADGTPFQYQNWANGGQPAANGSTLCTATSSNSTKWFADLCDNSRAYICELPPQVDHCPTSTCPAHVACPTSKPRSQCDDGWTYSNVTKKCYKNISGSFNDARSQCARYYGDLASIHDDAEDHWITDYLRGVLGDNWPYVCYIGLYSQDGDCNWSWADGREVNYVNWAPGQPQGCDRHGPLAAALVYNIDGSGGHPFRSWFAVDQPGWSAAVCEKQPNM